MVSDAASQFSIYNFFSVLLPGVFLLFGLYPFLPVGIERPGLLFLLPVLAFSFALGQLVHILSVFIERLLDIPSHRDQLKSEVCKSKHVAPCVSWEFHRACREQFPHLGLSYDKIGDYEDKKLGRSIYIHVRSVVESEGRGRAQIFQSIYAFCRSIYVSGIILALVYFVFAILILDDTFILPILGEVTISTAVVQDSFYEPIIGTVGIDPVLIVASAIAFGALCYYAFRHARTEYRRHYITYLMTEFILITSDQ